MDSPSDLPSPVGQSPSATVQVNRAPARNNLTCNDIKFDPANPEASLKRLAIKRV